MTTDPVTVCTIVRGRSDHLANLLEGLRRQTRRPDRVVVGWMGGPDIQRTCDASGLDVTVVDASSPSSDLPLAHARNVVRRHAVPGVLVFLDVDVIPAAACLADYADRVLTHGGVWSGHVTYLPPGVPGAAWEEADLRRAATPHPARTRPDEDTRLSRPELFWSLSFACASATFDRVGGFDEAYVGYGGEDTDIALRWADLGVALWLTPAAAGYHQHHPTRTPPVQHLDDIVRNAAVFRTRWGRWPMEGWLTAFRDMGLVEWEPDGSLLRRCDGARA